MHPKPTFPIPAQRGGRHNQSLTLAKELLAIGIPSNRAATIIKAYHDDPLPEPEIADILAHYGGQESRQPSPPKRVAKSPVEIAGDYLNSHKLPAYTTRERSQTPSEQAIEFLSTSFKPGELINIVTDFEREDLLKTRPKGCGETMTTEEWCEYIGKNGVPSSEAGAWLRVNPVTQAGSGKGGAFTDNDITSHRHLLLESDVLPLEIFVPLIESSGLPVASITTTGGSSRGGFQGAHALVKIEASSPQQYREFSKRILQRLKPYGIDVANSNPSRLTRLPGAVRKVGGIGSGLQALIYLPSMEATNE